jgi:hypothetical protein
MSTRRSSKRSVSAATSRAPGADSKKRPRKKLKPGPPLASSSPIGTPPNGVIHVPPVPAPGRVNHCGPGQSGYPSDYYIEIQGSITSTASQLLIINNQTYVRIQPAQFVLMLILASHARAKAGLSAPLRVGGGCYVPTEKIISLVDDLKSGTVTCGSQGKLPASIVVTKKGIYDAKWDLKVKIRLARRQPDFLEGLVGVGYRIFLPPGRIKIALVGEHDDEVFDWAE